MIWYAPLAAFSAALPLHRFFPQAPALRNEKDVSAKLVCVKKHGGMAAAASMKKKEKGCKAGVSMKDGDISENRGVVRRAGKGLQW